MSSDKTNKIDEGSILSVRHVTYTYVSEFADDEIDEADLGDPALIDVSLEVSPGTCTLLIGPSGSGKTSLSRLCNGIIPQYHPGVLEGDILLEGENMVEMPLADLSRRIGSVFQNPRSQFFCTDTTNEIAFACENFCMDRSEILERVSAARDTFNLSDILGRDIFRLSGGQKQRIACASVWAYTPDLYVFDEPSSNLDLASIHELRTIMLQLKNQGVGMVIAEHRIFYLMDIIDSVCIVERGHIVARYTPAQLAALSFECRAASGVRVQSLNEAKRLLPEAQDATSVEECSCPANHLEVRNLDVRLLSSGLVPSRVLDIDCLNLAFGEVIALIGPNGAGKTTFARSLVGLQYARHGSFKIDGKRLRAKERIKISYLVMQDVEAQLFTDSVFKEVELSMRKNQSPGHGKEDIEQHVTSLLEGLDLAPLAQRHPLSLSGGQKQRVVIAGALASDARIVVFDEPTSGLDFLHMHQVAHMVRDLADPRRLTVVVTHDIEFIALCCTQVVELVEGGVARQYAVDSAGIDRAIETLSKPDQEK